MKYPFHRKARGILFNHARHHRHFNTEAERVLWQHLRGGKLGFKFRRQHPIGSYIVDFYCHDCNLVVEADGLIHLKNDNPQYDRERTEFLSHLGLTVLRYSNSDILERTETVLSQIRKSFGTPPPLRPGEGAGPAPTERFAKSGGVS
jgi:very-short-patch-repair endonuclease